MKKTLFPLALSALALVSLEASAAGPPFVRNTAAGSTPTRVADAVHGVGLAPSTWGFVSHYEGTLYGTGYYAFRVDLTYAGTNSIYGYTFAYPTFGFVNEIRAIYAFDVSGLDGQPSPVWSSFMFDVRETPPAGQVGLAVFAEMALASSGGTHHLTGLSLFQGNGATNLDIYDAEDFENATPFDNPELAFTGSGQTLIGTVPVSTNTVIPIDFDVTNAVLNDLGPAAPPVVEVPVLGTPGITALALLLALAGALLLRR